MPYLLDLAYCPVARMGQSGPILRVIQLRKCICKAFGSTSWTGGHTFLVPVRRMIRRVKKCMPRVGFEHTIPVLVIKPTSELHWRLVLTGRCRWPGRRRRGSSAARLPRLRVLIPRGGMDVCLLCLLCVVKVEASATGRSLVQRSHTEGGVFKLV